MLDLNFVRDNLSEVEDKLRQRGMNAAEVLKDFTAIDAERRQAITDAETLQARKNTLGKEFQSLKLEEKRLKSENCDTTANDRMRAENLAEQDHLKKSIQSADRLAKERNAKLKEMLASIPNLPHASVPIGRTAEDNVEARRWGSPPTFDFQPKPHWELGEQLGILDLERAAKISGARFAVYWALGARLERALANFMLDLHTKEHGYTEVLPPYLVNSESMYGTGQLPKFEQDLFKVTTNKWEMDPSQKPTIGATVYSEDKNLDYLYTVVKIDADTRTVDLEAYFDDAGRIVESKVPWSKLLYARNLWLIPTAEVPVTNLYRDEVLDAA